MKKDYHAYTSDILKSLKEHNPYLYKNVTEREINYVLRYLWRNIFIVLSTYCFVHIRNAFTIKYFIRHKERLYS